jgi:hypothetical protein
VKTGARWTFGGIVFTPELGDWLVTRNPREPSMNATNRLPSSAPQQTTAGMIAIEIRFVSSLTKYTDSPRFVERVDVPAETTIGDLVTRYGLPLSGLSRVLCNGRDMNPGQYTGGNLDLGASISDGDVITFSGPATAVWGYGTAAV